MDMLLFVLFVFIFIFIGLIKILIDTASQSNRKTPRHTKPRRPRTPETPKVTSVPRQPTPIQQDIREEKPPFIQPPPPIPASIPQQFDYNAQWWKDYSKWYRNEKGWTCEKCQISLNDDRYYLHTHHIWGTQYCEPDDLIALCIACHAEQPGYGHSQLRQERGYHEFMEKYGNEWQLRSGSD